MSKTFKNLHYKENIFQLKCSKICDIIYWREQNSVNNPQWVNLLDSFLAFELEQTHPVAGES